eukprot:5743261-Prymnesium_polylepis.1
MEHGVVKKKKATRGKRQGAQRGMSGAYAKKVKKYFDCLLEGRPWELRNGHTEALDVDIIDSVLRDTNNATAQAIQSHEKVSLLTEDVARRRERASASAAGGACHPQEEAGGSSSADTPMPDSNQPLLGDAQEPGDVGTAMALSPPTGHAALSAEHAVQKPLEGK